MLGFSHEQARFYRTAGYFRLIDVLGSEEIATLKRFVIEAMAAEKDRRQGRNDKTPLIKLFRLYQRNPCLINDLIIHPQLVIALKGLLGPNVVFITNRHNHATVNDSTDKRSEVRLHRDILQPTRGLVTVIVYLEESTIDNGCTHIIPASHNLPFVGIPQPNGGGTWMDEHQEYDGLCEQALPVPMPEGSMLLFDSLAFHSVGQNSSNRTRISISLAFRSVDELDRNPDTDRQILVAGDYIYRGNDGI